MASAVYKSLLTIGLVYCIICPMADIKNQYGQLTGTVSDNGHGFDERDQYGHLVRVYDRRPDGQFDVRDQYGAFQGVVPFPVRR